MTDRSAETLGNPLQVYFEPGIHPLITGTAERQFSQVQHGNLNVHIWNEAVRERMKSYSPDLVAIDGLGVFDTVDSNAKASVWYSLPGRPSQINGTDEILVVAGDNTYNSQRGNSVEDLGIRLANMVMYAAAGTLGWHFISKLIRDSGRLAPKASADTDASKDQPSSMAVSRRQFFRGFVGASLFFNQPNVVAYAPWRFPEPLSTDVDNVAQSISLERLIDPEHEYEYIGGRTALLIAKIHDVAMTRRYTDKITAGSVVMGAAHTLQSNNLLSDPAMRADYMRKHTALMLEAAKGDNEFFERQWTDKQKQLWVIEQESKLQVFRVKEPNDTNLKQDPETELDRIVTLVDDISAPSVVKAIKGLA